MVGRGSSGALGADAEADVNTKAGGSRPIRVLHLRDSPWVDGPGRTILETAKRIDRSLIDYHVGAFVSDPMAPHPLVDALKECRLPVHEILDEGGIRADIVGRLVELMDRLQTDVLHTSEFRSNVLGLLCRRRRPVKLMGTAHGWIANDFRGTVFSYVDRVLLRRFNQVILVSHAMRRRLPRWWVPDAKVRVLHNALATDSYGLEVLDASPRGVDLSGEVRVLNVGRLSAEKGQELLLQAVAALSLEFPGLRLWFAGVGPLEQHLRRLAIELGLGQRVRFLGFVTDMPSLYRQVDLVVQSSLTEGLPNVMLEAAHLGVPVVATDVGGTAEVIEHRQTGWLVPSRSIDALREGIRCFLTSPREFVNMTSRARSRIEADFSILRRTQQQTRLYQDLACARE